MPSFHLVGPLRRLQALILDGLWLLPAAWAWAWFARAPDGRLSGWVLAAGWMALSLVVVPLWWWLGATPGQLWLSHRVVDAGGARHLSLPQALARWLGAWAGMLMAAVGVLWMCIDPHRQAWHDRLARTLVAEPGGEEAPSSTAVPSVWQAPDPVHSYWRRHARGELPLAQSLWVNGLLLAAPLALGLCALDAWLQLHLSGLRLGSVVLLLGWPLLLALLGWGMLGVWRSARPLWRAGATRQPAAARLKSRAAAALAVALQALVLLLAGLQAGSNVAPRGPDLLAQALGRDPLGQVAAQLSADGRRLHLRGPLAWGDAERVRVLLATAPQVQLVALASVQGRLDEALQLAALVRSHGLATRAVGDCYQVCPFVFLAGTRRQLLPGARLGLHRLSAGAGNSWFQGRLNRELRAHLLAAGLTPHLATKALATPPSALWVPEGDELAAAGLVSVPERPLDVDLPAPVGASLADYAEALSASPLWQALERRFPGAQALAAQRMHAAAGSGGAEAVQVAGHEVVAAVQPSLLARASPETRWLFTTLLREQVDALRAIEPALCRDLLLGEAAAHRRLPPSLAWREAEWLLATLAETPSGAALRRPTAPELEVIRRALGSRAPAQLANLWRPVAGPAARDGDCRLAQLLLTELSSLAAPERRLALRLMYERE